MTVPLLSLSHLFPRITASHFHEGEREVGTEQKHNIRVAQGDRRRACAEKEEVIFELLMLK